MNQRTAQIIVAIVIFLAGIFTLSVMSKKPANVNLAVSPTVAKIMLDGKKQVKPGKFYVSPGKHSLTVSFAGFATKTVSFTAKTSSSDPAEVNVLLQANSAAGRAWLAAHPEEAPVRESIGGSNFAAENRTRTQATPIIKSLPHVADDNSYRIDYGAGSSVTKVTIYITYSTDASKQAALAWIQAQGTDPASLSITYRQDPLLARLPYTSLDFSLSTVPGSSSSDKQQLMAQLFLSSADQADQSAAVARLEQEVLDYIRSVGADPNNYKISYQIVSS